MAVIFIMNASVTMDWVRRHEGGQQKGKQIENCKHKIG